MPSNCSRWRDCVFTGGRSEQGKAFTGQLAQDPFQQTCTQRLNIYARLQQLRDQQA